MIKLYGIFSPYVIRVKAALEFKGLEYEQISVDLRNKTQEFLDMNPNGKIPVIKDIDGKVVYESTNIVMYLDQKYPDSYRMISENIDERIMQLHLVGILDNISSSTTPLFLKKMGGADITQDIETVKPKIMNLSNAILQMYCGKEYLLGKFSYADACLLGLVFFAKKNFPELIHPEILSWFEYHLQKPEISRILPI